LLPHTKPAQAGFLVSAQGVVKVSVELTEVTSESLLATTLSRGHVYGAPFHAEVELATSSLPRACAVVGLLDDFVQLGVVAELLLWFGNGWDSLYGDWHAAAAFNHCEVKFDFRIFDLLPRLQCRWMGLRRAWRRALGRMFFRLH
jgi:hypothetical protein